MQRDLLSELHLPKLNLKSLENIVTENSKRLAYVIKENNEFIKNSKEIPPGLKVVMGNRLLDIDVNFPLSAPVENIETIKRKFIIKKALLPSEIFVENGAEKSPEAEVTNSTPNSRNSLKDSVTEGKIKCVEIRTLLATENHSSISPTAASLDACPVGSTETESLMRTVASSPSDEDSEVQILLDKSSNICSDLKSSSVKSSRSILKQNFKNRESVAKSPAEENIVSSTSNDVGEPEATTDLTDSSTPAMCIISEVIGNAHTTFAEADDPLVNVDETQESQIITPKKTNDITKIKGWRRKQFFVEKPTTIEFYSVSKGCRTLKKKIELRDYLELSEEPGNKENAFVCDSLDEFLDQEAELKIGYEVPHLFAEFGIKLTSDEIVSRPSLSEKDIEEVGTRYCVPISLPNDNTNLDDIKDEIEEVDIKSVKRPIEDDSKPCKTVKIDGCKRQKFTQKLTENWTTELPIGSSAFESRKEGVQKTECRLSRAYKNFSNIKLQSKLIGLVVYPGPFRPLHPVVQYHLKKLRSCRTTVDENWANFAASALIGKDARLKRRIVPAYCCVRVRKRSTNINEQILKTKQKKVNKEQIRLKECRVVIERLKPSQLCMEHSCYNCSRCGLARTSTRSLLRIHSVKKSQKIVKNKQEGEEEEEEEQGETVTVSPRASFNKKIARLLAKKVRLLKANGDTLTSIDSLKITKRDTIEFIKLKFVKESFLAGRINIWYLKPASAGVRSRAFLTFSESSPVPNAINLKSTGICFKNLPKVITEIVSAENTFDSNEYAILHCISGIWEIHGSLNITFGNTDKYVEQIFTSLELPELSGLQDIAEKILHVKAVKWWVLDLTQKFKLIELRSGNFSTVVTRKRFLDLIKSNSFGFIALRQDYEYRLLGAYVMQRLLPFVLLGPYYLLETHDLTLKGSSSTVPFRYYGEERVTTNYPLKFFINSVIENLQKKKNKTLEGLWLYDKMCLDRTSYIEVVTTDVDNQLPSKDSVIDIEHGYSLNSLTHSSFSGTTSGIVRRKDGKDELQTVTVYLYFDVFELGFLEGELQFDNSVLIRHPLDKRTKMKSHKIGDWFLNIIRRRVVFIPNDLPVRWFITKHKEDLRNRPPFNKFILGGAHIVTKKGVFYLLELSETKIERLGLDKNEIVRVMSQCEVLNEVRELKNLSKLLMSDLSTGLSMEGVLTKATNEIKDLETLQKNMESERACLEVRKLTLALHFLRLVNSFNIRSYIKIKMIENVEHLFLKENGELDEEFVKRLKQTLIGWKYMKYFRKYRGNTGKGKLDLANGISELLKLESSKSAGVELLCSLRKLSKSYPGLNKSPERPLSCSSNANAATNGTPPQSQFQAKKTRPPSEPLITITPPKILRTSSPVKDSSQMGNTESEKVKSSEIIVFPKVRKTLKVKDDGFLKLSSTDLPSNIKLCWRNWSVKKLEVT